MKMSEKKIDQKAYCNPNNAKSFNRGMSILVIGFLLFGIFLIGASTHPSEETRSQITSRAKTFELNPTTLPAQKESSQSLNSQLEHQVEPEKLDETFHWIEGEVVRNQSFSNLMIREGIKLKTVLELVEQSKPTYNLSRFHAGQPYVLKLTSDTQLVSFTYHTNDNRKLLIERDGDEFTSRLTQPEYEMQMVILEGVVQENLISAILEAGGGYQVAMDLEEIFGWQINFFKDLRKGDTFKILLEKLFSEKKFYGFGKIKAATIMNRGGKLAAVFFKPEGGQGGYYSPDGRSLKKQFLKSPLKYTRISSGYTQMRFHPIYKRNLSHQAVDYAAPRGTPIHAISDGKVLSLSVNGRSGKHIKLGHRNGYESSYSHLSGYATNISRGNKIEQGQVIGYVGSTGAATGPHLCFHLRKNGKSINPLTFQSPGGPNLKEENRESFLLTTLKRLRILNYPEPLKTKVS
ncbi:peptidoglycan DD-metalloendopeptidase family protein [Nitrospinae bacterium]|nr:peptidoglycan DD-metalloendopeptidase family protein [Nitrospinota bacterium]